MGRSHFRVTDSLPVLRQQAWDSSELLNFVNEAMACLHLVLCMPTRLVTQTHYIKQTRQSTALNYLEFITAEACAENILMENQPEIMNYDDLCKTFSATRIKSFSRLLNLPEDLLFILLDQLELVSLYHLGLACRHLHDMVSTRHQCLRKHVLIKQVSLVILPCLYW